MQNIPLIIPVFNQLTYLINIINWWRWYYPQNMIYILDNGSDYLPLRHAYKNWYGENKISIVMCSENDMAKNLKRFLDDSRHFVAHEKFQYYAVSDPDIMPHPGTPPNFLDIFRHAIENCGFHHAGFGLITHDLPDFLEDKATVLSNESEVLTKPASITYEGKTYSGFNAPIDTTFALYKRSNGGWHAPQGPESWSNSLRLFQAFHLGWYLHPQMLNEEMRHYFATAKFRDLGPVSAGKNNYRPKQYQPK